MRLLKLFVTCALGVMTASALFAARARTSRPKRAALPSFEVASVKQNISGQSSGPNFPLDTGDAYPSDAGFFSAIGLPLWAYVGFAYKLSTTEGLSLSSQLPKWANNDRFDIQARAHATTTKDEMRLMMQSLLADRFKLVAHFETRQTHIFALVLVKPGSTGPMLKAHLDNPPCADLSRVPAPIEPANGGLPGVCGAFGMRQLAGHTAAGARNITMEQFAENLPMLALGSLDRPVIDETGLSGRFDFSLDWTPQSGNGFESMAPAPVASTSQSNVQSDFQESPLLDALKEELGLKLEANTGFVRQLIIDHIEEPSPN